MEEVVRPILPSKLVSNKTKFFINPTGRFVVGGPMGDSGLTGRKIIVDTYGGMGRHGGGAFSGKDPSKVDRSACYYARYIAKNVVAAGLARRCEVQVAYAIGVAEPVSLLVHTFGTGTADEDRLAQAVRATFDCRPGALIKELDLLRPIYQKTSNYGHFGRADADFYWERTDKAEALKAAVRKAQAAGAAATNGKNGNGKNGSSKPAAVGGKAKRRGDRGAARSLAKPIGKADDPHGLGAAPHVRGRAEPGRALRRQLVLDEVDLLELRRALGGGDDADLSFARPGALTAISAFPRAETPPRGAIASVSAGSVSAPCACGAAADDGDGASAAFVLCCDAAGRRGSGRSARPPRRSRCGIVWANVGIALRIVTAPWSALARRRIWSGTVNTDCDAGRRPGRRARQAAAVELDGGLGRVGERPAVVR